MKKLYHLTMYKIKYRLWYWWHCSLRRFFDGKYPVGMYHDRPFYHMCCNGNAGGWRTDLCDSLEDYSTGYRYHEEQLYKLGVYDDEI